ncbi:MAG: type II secretion system F family protein [Bacillota bacterium]
MASLILLLTFISVTAFVWALFLLLTREQRALAERLTVYTSKSIYGRREKKERPTLSWKEFINQGAKLFAAREIAKKWEAEMIKANIPLRGEEFVFINLLTTVGGGLVGWLLARNISGGIILLLLGFLLPRLLVNSRKAKRVHMFDNQLGDALLVMSNSLRAGFSFLQAMDMVSREMPAPISEEFARALREMSLGTTTEEALEKMTQRVESEDLDLVVTAVLIQRQVGGNLSEVLESIANTIRERVRIKGEIKTLTAQGRISGMIISLLPVAVGGFIFLINPSYMMPLFTSPLGWSLIIGGLVSQGIGMLIIKKIINIKV